MERRDIEHLINNEAEWRRYILQEMAEIKRVQGDLVVTATTLKVKFGLIGTIFGAISGGIVSLFIDALKHK